MRATRRRVAVQAFGALLSSAALAAPAAAAGGGTSPSDSNQALAGQANNPNAPLMQFQLRDVMAPRLPNADGTGNLFQLEAVVPFRPLEFFPLPTIMKITAPVAVTVPEPVGKTGFGNLQFFDQAVFEESWGSWALGVSAVFPSADTKVLGQQTWQAGPAAAIMYTGVEHLVVGAVFQNPVSLNSSSHRTKSNALTITPTLTYNLPDGWFLGYTDFNWTLNWEDNGAATIPLGLQGGRVFNIASQAVSFSLEAGYNVSRPSDTNTPRWMIGIEFTLLFPEK